MEEKQLEEFKAYLMNEEKRPATIEKYLRDVRAFFNYAGGSEMNKKSLLSYKQYISERYKPSSVNSMLVSVNCYMKFTGNCQCCVRLLKIQRQIFCKEDKELEKEDYCKLLEAAKGSRTYYILRTLCETGIRVSELKYITKEAVKTGRAVVDCKNKTRVIFISSYLQNILSCYAEENNIVTGELFVSQNGISLDRSNIWRDLKKLCAEAGVSEEKVYPHNFRHLFARTFYSIDKDIVRLADILGHSSINTTRIYMVESGACHIERLGQLHKKLTTT